MGTNAKRITAIMAFVVPVVLVAACAGGYLYRMAQNTSIPQRVKLMDCTNQIVTADFHVPKGMLFHLVLGGATSFSGTDSVREGTNVIDEFQFSDAAAMKCNWLDSRGYPHAKILNWKSHEPLPLRIGSVAQFTVAFTTPPPTNATIWLTYVQRYGDTKKR
jgi:hypothetical protein